MPITFADDGERYCRSQVVRTRFASTNDEVMADRLDGLNSSHWGRGGLETNENILSTLQALVESTCHLPADNRLGTFQMFLQVPGRTHDVGTFMEYFEYNINMCNTFDPS